MKNCLWMLTLVVMVWSCTPKPEENLLLENTRTALDNKEWEKADEAARELIKHYPENPDGYNMLGFSLLQRNEPFRADSCFQKALLRDSTNYKYFFNSADARNIISTQTNEPRDFLTASVLYAKAIELQPNIPDLYIKRAVMVNNLTGYYEASVDLNMAIKLQPENGFSHYLLGRTYRNLANQDTMFLGQERVGFTPEMKKAWRDSAITVFTQALELEGDEQESTLLWLGMTYMENNQPNEACEAWEKAKELGVETADTNLHLNCEGFTDEHSEEEVAAILEELNQRIKTLEEGHFDGDGHDH
ncbi:MAG: tetratricopeptide repeat protein [Bacteroidota bacterium]